MSSDVAEKEVERLRAALVKLQAELHETFCAPDWPDDNWCEFVRLSNELSKEHA